MENNPINNNRPKNKKGIGFYWIYIVLIAFFVGSLFFKGTHPAEDINKGELMEMLKSQDIEVEIQ